MSSIFDPIELSSSSDEDETPLSVRLANKKKWQQVPGEGQELTGQAYWDRAHRFRERAQTIFESEKSRILSHSKVGLAEKKHLEPYTLVFDRGTRRRGVCKYPNRTTRPTGYIGVSAKMVDGGVSTEKLVNILRHELSHACKPGMKHNEVWKQFFLMIGGDGKRCCADEEVKKAIGHRIEVYCPQDVTHFLKKMQKRPSKRWLQSKVCGKCRSRFLVKSVSVVSS